MSLSTLPPSYCTNVHPGLSVDEVTHGLREFTSPAQKLFGERLAAGLWLAAPVIAELNDSPRQLAQLRETLAEGQLVCYTLNTFPFGNFHSQRVKENVYLPDWASPERLAYTADCARVLCELMPTGVEGSLSTVPLGFKGFEHPAGFRDQCIRHLLMLAEQLDQLHDETGQVVRLAIEPEPCCVLETTPETIAFFDQMFRAASEQGQEEIARRHLGVCYDVCHQAVEFEDIETSLKEIDIAGIRLNKIHITCAIHLPEPATNVAGREMLQSFVEQRYLHQTFAKLASGERRHFLDLSTELCANPPEDFRSAQAWRIHFHVPVHKEAMGPLHTTRPELRQALQSVAKLDYAPHLEVETYTWGVLPGEQAPTLAEGLAAELKATRDLLAEVQQGTQA